MYHLRARLWLRRGWCEKRVNGMNWTWGHWVTGPSKDGGVEKLAPLDGWPLGHLYNILLQLAAGLLSRELTLQAWEGDRRVQSWDTYLLLAWMMCCKQRLGINARDIIIMFEPCFCYPTLDTVSQSLCKVLGPITINRFHIFPTFFDTMMQITGWLVLDSRELGVKLDEGGYLICQDT